uniref:Uncharacterized protein n=1 Tax=Octopus bimaculoides TaxID=37653 RepID=A0A0L8I7L7_OCTBM
MEIELFTKGKVIKKNHQNLHHPSPCHHHHHHHHHHKPHLFLIIVVVKAIIVFFFFLYITYLQFLRNIISEDKNYRKHCSILVQKRMKGPS